MVRTIDLINHVKANADAGVGADADGCYGTQCVDEVNDLSITFLVNLCGEMRLICSTRLEMLDMRLSTMS